MPTRGSKKRNRNAPAATRPVGPIPRGSLETAHTFSSEMDAHLAQSKLASEGIHSTVHRFSRYRAIASGGYLVKVPLPDLARAKEILKMVAEKQIDMDEYVDKDDDSYTRCPKCESVNVETAPLTRAQLIVVCAGLGIPIFFIDRDHSCRRCKHTWKG